MRKVAIIDMGTNTFHLLIVEINGAYQIIHRDRIAVKIGKDGINQSTITVAAFARALDAMKEFRTTISRFDVDEVIAIGTSALRNADNQQEVVSQIRQATGIVPRIISGEEEARYIYLGVRSAVDLGTNAQLVMDIGGGSIEFIIGNATQILWMRSFEIGAQRLLERFHHHDPILSEEIELLNQHLADHLVPLLQALRKYEPKVLVGASGSFDTLSEVFALQQGLGWDATNPEVPLTIDGFKRIYQMLVSKNRSERMDIPGMIEMRVDMIVVACCVINYLMEHHGFEQVKVSTYSLKEGVLADLTGAMV
ncbi:MAG: exopolyphosphatase [Cyclobacteriaceae bacterium]